VASGDFGPFVPRLRYPGAVKVLGLAVLLAACSFQASPTQSAPSDSSSSGSDTGVDTTVTPPIDGGPCFGTGLVKVCFDATPTGAVTLPGATNPLDTGVSGSCTKIVTQVGGPDLCVIAGMTVTVSGPFVAIGTRPLVLIGADSVSVPGTLDVSSKIAGGSRKGAGANDSGCTTGGNGKNDSGGGGGGAGGSFGTAGGAGGTGDKNDNGMPRNGVAPGGAAGAEQATPLALRGGCKGSAGGEGANTDTSHTGGAGGDGGGAVYLIAGNMITIAGDVFASGAGGSVTPGNGGFEQGAGGGGSGGMIGLDAPTIQVTGRIAANGGAGAGGGADMGGTPGGDGTTAMWDKRAPGGNGDKNPMGDAGDGADGSTVNLITNLGGASADAAGGGGAGGLGLVWTWGTVTGAMISPAPVKH
jgi:hypothetical protein